MEGREAFHAPDDDPPRYVYVCRAGCLAVRNHLAVRDVLRTRSDLRDRYGAVELDLARDPALTSEDYLAGKSAVLQEVLALGDLTDAERAAVLALNTGGAAGVGGPA